MGGGGLRLGRVFGIEVLVDPSWLIIAFLVNWAIYLQLSDEYPGNNRGSLWLVAALAALLFFGSVLVHELSHSVVAQRNGMTVRRIRLFVFGGVSELEGEPPGPKVELAVTIVGPLSSLALAGVLWVLSWMLTAGTPVWSGVRFVAFANFILGLFNLLPGFPLDGGRVLRAVVWSVTGNRSGATRVAVWGGRVVAAGLIVLGTAPIVLEGDLGGLWFIAIGWFLISAANSSLRRLELEDALAGVTAGQIMSRDFLTAPAYLSLQEFFDAYVVSHNLATYVVEDAGRVAGLMGVEQLRAVPRERWAFVELGEAMAVVPPEEMASPHASVLTLIDRLAEGGGPIVIVVDGRAVGLIGTSDIAVWMQRAGL